MSINHKMDFLEFNKQKIIKFFEEGYTQTEIRKIFKVADETFRKFIRLNNIGIRTFSEVKQLMDKRNYKNIPDVDIVNTYLNFKKVNKTANFYHISQKRVLHVLHKYNVVKKSRKYISEDEIKKLYHDKKLSMRQVAISLNISKTKLNSLFKKYNIHIRDDAYLRKKYILPSGKIVFIQGYEPKFLDFVFNNNIFQEEDICFKPNIINYIDENGHQRKYIPDFYISKFNLIIEIKSSWILKIQNENRVKCKEIYTKKEGYNFTIIIDNDFTSFLKYIDTLC